MGIIRECGGKMHMSEGKQGMAPLQQFAMADHSFCRELEERPKRLLRIVPELRRGRLAAAHPSAEVSGADDDADGLGHQSVRLTRDQAI